jgi:hypothetical protein
MDTPDPTYGKLEVEGYRVTTRPHRRTYPTRLTHCAVAQLLQRRVRTRAVPPQIDPLSGEAPPIANARDAITRTDVLVQALRAGLVLQAAGQLTDEIGEMWRPRRRALQAAVLGSISPEGGIIFDRVGGHRNAWASMFAWQALRFLREAQMGKLDPIASATALI